MIFGAILEMVGISLVVPVILSLIKPDSYNFNSILNNIFIF